MSHAPGSRLLRRTLNVLDARDFLAQAHLLVDALRIAWAAHYVASKSAGGQSSRKASLP